MANFSKLYYSIAMNGEAYTIIALLVRYVLIGIVFLAIIQAIKESRKDNIYRSFASIASLSIVDTKVKHILEQENIIGRANKNDIVIKDWSVKRTHARLFLESDEWTIEPYRHATVFVNLDEVGEKHVVEDGDEIVLGDMVCVFNKIEPVLEEALDEED